MTNEKTHCSFCNLLVASADPYLVRYQGQVAHSQCVIRTADRMWQLLRAVQDFTQWTCITEVQEYWRQAGPTVRNRADLIKALRVCFRKIDDWRQRYGAEGSATFPCSSDVATMRQLMSQALFCEL